ncbi:hypothetical protein D3C78_1855040 [compost metagenome]
MVAVSRIGHIAARVANPRGDHARVAPQQILHAPEAAAGEDGGFGLSGHGVSFLFGMLGIAMVMRAGWRIPRG